MDNKIIKDYDNSFEIKKSKIHGVGVFSNISIDKNERLFLMWEVICSQRSLEQKLLFQSMIGLSNVDIEQIVSPHLLTVIFDLYIEPLAWKINHQINSNCKSVKLNNIWYCESVRHIEIDEEITMDYRKLPAFMSRNIKGYKELSQEVAR